MYFYRKTEQKHQSSRESLYLLLKLEISLEICTRNNAVLREKAIKEFTRGSSGVSTVCYLKIKIGCSFPKKTYSCLNQLMNILCVTPNLRLHNHKSSLWAYNLLIHISELMQAE